MKTPKEKPKALVLSSGGLVGWLYAHSLKNLKTHLSEIESFSGTSVGALIATLCCFIDYDEILDILPKSFGSINLKELSLNLFLKSFGFSNHLELVVNFVKNIINEKLNLCDPTLKEFYNKTQKNLFICAYNVKSKSIVYFNHENNGDVKLCDALRASASIPFIFPCCKINDEYYIDGAVKDPIPFIPLQKDYKNEEILIMYNEWDCDTKPSNSKEEINNSNIYEYISDVVFSIALVSCDINIDCKTICYESSSIPILSFSEDYGLKNFELLRKIAEENVELYLSKYNDK